MSLTNGTGRMFRYENVTNSIVQYLVTGLFKIKMMIYNMNSYNIRYKI